MLGAGLLRTSSKCSAHLSSLSSPFDIRDPSLALIGPDLACNAVDLSHVVSGSCVLSLLCLSVEPFAYVLDIVPLERSAVGLPSVDQVERKLADIVYRTRKTLKRTETVY